MAKYRPGKSGVPTRKIKEVKKKIKEVKKSPRDARDDQRYEELLMLLRKLEARELQKQDRISDRDIQYDNFKMGPMSEEERKRLFPKIKDTDRKKGGGHVKKYTGGKSGDKYYGGGPVYPRPTKGN